MIRNSTSRCCRGEGGSCQAVERVGVCRGEGGCQAVVAGAKVALPSRCWWCEGGFVKSLSGEVWLGGRCIKDSVAQRQENPTVERQNRLYKYVKWLSSRSTA